MFGISLGVMAVGLVIAGVVKVARRRGDRCVPDLTTSEAAEAAQSAMCRLHARGAPEGRAARGSGRSARRAPARAGLLGGPRREHGAPPTELLSRPRVGSALERCDWEARKGSTRTGRRAVLAARRLLPPARDIVARLDLACTTAAPPHATLWHADSR